METLSRDVLARFPPFTEVKPEGTQMMVLLDNRVIRIHHVLSTCYLIWLSHYNEINCNNQTGMVHTNVPAIVVMNGKHSYQHMAVLLPNAGRQTKHIRPIDLTRVLLEEDLRLPVYVGEVDPRNHQYRGPQFVVKTTAQALETVTKPALTMEHPQEPLFQEEEDETLVIASPTHEELPHEELPHEELPHDNNLPLVETPTLGEKHKHAEISEAKDYL